MFQKEVYAERRLKLKKEIQGGIALFMANQEAAFNYPANTYAYRQDSHFSYFFGLNHPGFAGVIDLDNGKEILFGDDVEIDDIIWMGPQPSVTDQAAQVGINEVYTFSKLEDFLKKSLTAGRTVHYLPPYRGAMMITLGRMLGIAAHDVKAKASVSLIKAVVKLRDQIGA